MSEDERIGTVNMSGRAVDKPVIIIGHHTINQLMAGQTVEISVAIMLPASDLSTPTPAADPVGISRELMCKIVDEVFDGVIKRHELDEGIDHIIADDRPVDEANIATARSGIAAGEKTLLATQSPAMTFSSDDDAIEFLKLYGHEESRNGVIRGDWRSFDTDCRAAVGYLCDEWDFVFEDTTTPAPTTSPVGDPHDIGRAIMERIAKVHPWKEQCVADIAQAVTRERDIITLREAQLRYVSTQWPDTSAGKYARACLKEDINV